LAAHCINGYLRLFFVLVLLRIPLSLLLSNCFRNVLLVFGLKTAYSCKVWFSSHFLSQNLAIWANIQLVILKYLLGLKVVSNKSNGALVQPMS